MNLSNTIDPSTSAVRSDLAQEAVLGQYIPLLYHYNMLQDADRVGAFRRAIDLIVQPDMHVVELGGGTGILSSFAARRGARVTCVERNPELVATSRRFLKLNGLTKQVSVVQADAAEFIPDTPVDAVVCEMLHVGLMREKQISVIDAFKQNYRKAFGRVHRDRGLPVFIPEFSILMAQVVQQCFEFEGYQAPVPIFQAPKQDQPGTVQMSELQPYANIDYQETVPQRFQIDQKVSIETAGRVNAVRLVTQNVLTVDESEQCAVTWPNQCLVVPIDRPIDVVKSEWLQLRFDYLAGATVEDFIDSVTVCRVTNMDDGGTVQMTAMDSTMTEES